MPFQVQSYAEARSINEIIGTLIDIKMVRVK